jgi:methylmalonyl-CoA/ethylmalonyl-CoA epimerase
VLTLDISSHDRDATRRLLADGLGLPSDSPDRYLLGQVALAIHDPGDDGRTGPSRLTVHADDPAPLTDALADTGRPVDDAGCVTVCGVALRVTTEKAGATAPLPDGIVGLDHIGIATDDSAALVAALAALGFAHESRQIDTQFATPTEVFSSDRYGVVTHAGEPVQAGALLVTFLRRGGADVELLEDILTSHGHPGEGPGSTTGDNRAIARFVERSGGGLHHVAVRVDDIEAGLARLRKAGVGLLDDHGRPGSRRSRIAFAERRSTGGLVLHLVQHP